MVKRICQHVDDPEGARVECPAEATWVTWLTSGKDVGVYECAAHYDPAYTGWIMRGEPSAEHSPDGFEWEGA